MRSLKNTLQDMFALDLRSLALFRILLGLCLFIDLSYRIFFVHDFYSDAGVLPREALLSKFMSAWESSLFLISGQTWVITLLMAVAIVSSVALMFGFYTRLAAFVCWILVVSTHTRNGVILHGGDDVFRVLLFWCQFVPLSSCYSLDAFLNKEKPTTFRHISWGSTGLLLQLLYIYIFTGILKIHPVWHTEGTGVYYALHLHQFSSTLGQKLLPYESLMQVMSYLTLMLELAVPLLVISPIALFRQRTLAVVSFTAFHVGLALMMELGVFPWLCISAWMMVLPHTFWDRVGGLHWQSVVDWATKLRDDGLKAPSSLWRPSRILSGIAAIFLILVTTWNIYEVDNLALTKPTALRWVMSVSEMYQRWSMFAPYPRKDDGWYVIEATTFDGRVFDPFQDNHKLMFDKPYDVAATYKNSMWRKYLTNIWLKSHYDYRLYFGRYLCREWNTKQERKESKINTIHIHYMMEMTQPPGDFEPEIIKETTWRHYCYDKPEGWVD